MAYFVKAVNQQNGVVKFMSSFSYHGPTWVFSSSGKRKIAMFSDRRAADEVVSALKEMEGDRVTKLRAQRKAAAIKWHYYTADLHG